MRMGDTMWSWDSWEVLCSRRRRDTGTKKGQALEWALLFSLSIHAWPIKARETQGDAGGKDVVFGHRYLSHNSI